MVINIGPIKWSIPVDPVILLKRNYHKAFKISGKVLCITCASQKYLQRKSENKLNMPQKGE